MDSLSFIAALDLRSVIAIFWYAVLFEIPRYTLGSLAAATVTLWSRRPDPIDPHVSLSVLLVGHNEEKSLRACVESLGEQTILRGGQTVEIVVVNDGSTDRMEDVANALYRDGRIDRLLHLGQRGGKSAGVNAALAVCTGDIVIIADIDTTFDRDALAELTTHFSDPRVGAVGGNIGVRNANATVMTRFQQIEYAVGLSLGRCLADALGTLAVVSGAFGAFRRTALEGVGGMDVEVGEDADSTMKLRRAGWTIRFAFRAHCLTDVPETVAAFIAQRLRWDRGLVTIWSRKFRGALDPRQSAFRPTDLLIVLDIVFFQILLAVAFPIYLGWLFYYFGPFATTIIGVTLVGYAVLDLVSFGAALFLGTRLPASRLIDVPLYVLLQVSLVRAVRLVAVIQELIFRSSYRDPYVPRRVMSQVEVR